MARETMRNGTKILIGFIITNQLVIYTLVLVGLFTDQGPEFWPAVDRIIIALSSFSALAFSANEWRKAAENTKLAVSNKTEKE
jgi:hypothetical protein